jgi:hypothetical protein
MSRQPALTLPAARLRDAAFPFFFVHFAAGCVPPQSFFFLAFYDILTYYEKRQIFNSCFFMNAVRPPRFRVDQAAIS